MEWKLFDGDIPEVSTFRFHEHRERAPHIDQPEHQPRMETALAMVGVCKARTVLDLGCGDGGFLQAVREFFPGTGITGFDFTPDMENGWRERDMLEHCSIANVFPLPPAPAVDLYIEQLSCEQDVTVMTEVLEHLARPHEVLTRIHSKYIIVSSPWGETDRLHDECHAWAWDMEGYELLVRRAGFGIVSHRKAGFSQVILASNGR